MWIESENETIINNCIISKIYIVENTKGLISLCYIDNEGQTKVLYDNLTKESAEIIYKNLKPLLYVKSGFISKEQLLEGII